VRPDRGPNRLDRRGAQRSAFGVAIDPAAERDGQLWLRDDVVTVDADRRRALEAEELGIVGPVTKIS